MKHIHRADSLVQTYVDLRKLAKKFAENDQMHSLVIFGTPGLGKTETFATALKDEYVKLIKGRLSGFKLYKTLETYKDALFLFDDTRRILKDAECINLLMSVGEHRPIKTIQWNTSSIEEEAEFTTKSRICLLINKVYESSEDLEPLFSRSLLMRFAPSNQEVHRYVGEWWPTSARRKAIYEWIGEHLDVIPVSDIRDYLKAELMYDLGWKAALMQTWQADRYTAAAVEVFNWEKKTGAKTKQQKADKFKELCGGSPAQYYWLLKNKLAKR